MDSHRKLKHCLGEVNSPGVFVQIRQVSQREPLRALVADLTQDGQCLLKGGLGLLYAPGVAVHVRQASEHEAFEAPASDLAVEGQRLMQAGVGLLYVPGFLVHKGQICERAALVVPVASFPMDGQCLLQGCLGLLNASGFLVNNREASKRVALATPVSDLAVDCQRLLKGALGLLHAPGVPVDNREASKRAAFVASVADLAMDGQRLLIGLLGLLYLPGFVAQGCHTYQRVALATPVSDLAVDGQRLLNGGLGLLHAPGVPVDTRQVSQRDALEAPVANLAVDGQRLLVAGLGADQVARLVRNHSRPAHGLALCRTVQQLRESLPGRKCPGVLEVLPGVLGRAAQVEDVERGRHARVVILHSIVRALPHAETGVAYQLGGDNVSRVRLELMRIDGVQRRGLWCPTAKGLLDQFKRQSMKPCAVAGHLQLIRGIAHERVAEQVGGFGAGFHFHIQHLTGPWGQGLSMPTQLSVLADASSILRNILNYFSDNFACMQELLQNARRAEASEVRVEIDTRAGTVTVTDNGHGVIDPEDLLNIGKSDWAEGVRAERPAGMGLFSVFKLGGLAEVRSGRWRLTLDYDAMCAGKPAVYEGLLPAIKGTQVIIRSLKDGFDTPDGLHPEGYAARWAREAEFMPFRTTTIVVDGEARVVEPFNPLAAPDGALRVTTAWGWIDLCTEAPERGESRHHATLVQQGIEMETKKLHLSGMYDSPWVRIFARPGTVNFTLPDRDALLDDAKFRALIREVKQASVDAVVGRITEFGDDGARRKLAGLVYSWDILRVIELPEDLQHVRVRLDREYLHTLSRKDAAARITKGSIPCSFEPGYHTAFELLPLETMQLPESEVGLFKAMFPEVPVVRDVSFAVTADDRSDLMWRCGAIALAFDSGETRVVQPVPEQTVLVDGALDGEFVPDNRERADFRSGYDFAVVHSCADAVMYPNLDPWQSWHEEAMDSDQADELWHTSDYAVHIVATWPGVPANDVTPDELVTLLRDRLADGKDCSFRFTDAKFEFEWSNRLSIRSMVVEVIEHGQVTRTVRLVENCGYLQETTR